MILGLVYAAAWSLPRLRLSVEGGGFRPISYVELVDLAALNALDNDDAERANRQAKRRADSYAEQRERR